MTTPVMRTQLLWQFRFGLMLLMQFVAFNSLGAPLILQPGAVSYATILQPERTDMATQLTFNEPLGPFASMFAGEDHTCGIEVEGRLWCWGWGLAAQIGDGDWSTRFLPVELRTISRVATGAAGHEHTCAIILSDGLWCWGNNSQGQLGETLANRTHPWPRPVTMPTVDSASHISAGHLHTCALVQGAAWCWGRNTFGQTAAPVTHASSKPNRVGTWSNASWIDAGADRSCLVAGGDVWCWGQVLGMARRTPVRISINAATRVDTGHGEHNCILNQLGIMYCWGSNSLGQLGNNNHGTGLNDVPRVVWGLFDVTHMALGAQHTCAVTNDEVWCWGLNNRGQLGDGTLFNRRTAAKVQLPNGIHGISAMTAGLHHTCITARGNMWCWGSNSQGQLGVGAHLSHSAIPVRVDVHHTPR